MPVDLALPLTEARFTVVDLETTGFKPPAARVTELAAVRVRGGELDLELAQMVDPGCSIPSEIEQMTGITNAMVAGQPTIDDVWGYFRSFLEDSVVVAHNAPFDMAFLDHESLRLMGAPLPNPEVCTVKVSRRAWPALERHNLDSVAAHLGLNFMARHRALGDAKVTAQVLLDSLPYLAQHGIDTLGELLKMQRSPRCEARLATMGVEAPWARHGT